MVLTSIVDPMRGSPLLVVLVTYDPTVRKQISIQGFPRVISFTEYTSQQSGSQLWSTTSPSKNPTWIQTFLGALLCIPYFGLSGVHSRTPLSAFTSSHNNFRLCHRKYTTSHLRRPPIRTPYPLLTTTPLYSKPLNTIPNTPVCTRTPPT